MSKHTPVHIISAHITTNLKTNIKTYYLNSKRVSKDVYILKEIAAKSFYCLYRTCSKTHCRDYKTFIY
jgi:hypothetical protein